MLRLLRELLIFALGLSHLPRDPPARARSLLLMAAKSAPSRDRASTDRVVHRIQCRLRGVRFELEEALVEQKALGDVLLETKIAGALLDVEGAVQDLESRHPASARCTAP